MLHYFVTICNRHTTAVYCECLSACHLADHVRHHVLAAQICTRGVIDLGVLAKRKQQGLAITHRQILSSVESGAARDDTVSGPAWALSDLCRVYLKKELPKEPSVRLCNWEKRPLSREELTYAALDAFASRQLWISLSLGADLSKFAEAAASTGLAASSRTPDTTSSVAPMSTVTNPLAGAGLNAVAPIPSAEVHPDSSLNTS